MLQCKDCSTISTINNQNELSMDAPTLKLIILKANALFKLCVLKVSVKFRNSTNVIWYSTCCR